MLVLDTHVETLTTKSDTRLWTPLLVHWMRMSVIAGDTALISGLGRVHIPWRNNPRAATKEPVYHNYQSPSSKAWAPQQREVFMHHNWRAAPSLHN